MDELLSMRRKTRLFLAHPKAIAAFFRQCNRSGPVPGTVNAEGHEVPAWRGVPIFPCGKSPISPQHTSSIIALRTGEKDQGVVGLHQTGIPEEYEPSLIEADRVRAHRTAHTSAHVRRDRRSSGWQLRGGRVTLCIRRCSTDRAASHPSSARRCTPVRQ